MLARCSAIVLAAAFAATVAAPGGASMVCRYSGRTLDPCDCPTARTQQGCSVEDLGCCELRVSVRASFSGLAASQDRRSPVPIAVAVGSPRLGAQEAPLLEAPRRPRTPRWGDTGDPLYLRLRQLLI